MKYLKSYNESKKYNIIEDVKDILLEWSDKGTRVSVNEGGRKDDNGWHSAIHVQVLQASISRIHREGIDVDTVIRLFNYMISEGYNCSKIHLTDNNGADYIYIYIDKTKPDFGIDEYELNSWRYLDMSFLKIKKLHEVKTYRMFEMSKHKGDKVNLTTVYHKSNPIFRDSIDNEGLKPMKGESYTIHSPDEINPPAIFGYVGNIDYYDSTYDDDIWVIDTKGLNNEWFVDKEVGESAVLTYTPIPRSALTLKYKGTGKSL